MIANELHSFVFTVGQQGARCFKEAIHNQSKDLLGKWKVLLDLES